MLTSLLQEKVLLLGIQLKNIGSGAQHRSLFEESAMSNGPPPPPYYAPGYPWYPPPGPPGHHGPPHGHHPPHHGHHPPPHGHHPPPHYPPPPELYSHYPGGSGQPPMPYYIPGAVMLPVPVPSGENPTQQPTYITNYIYHGDQNPGTAASSTQEVTEIVKVAETSGEFDWVPTTTTLAGHLTGRAVVGGHEGWDGSPLWIIRSWHNGDLVPGKLSVRHNSGSIPYDGREVPVQNIEVLCSKENSLRWVPGANGNVPPSAIVGGQTASGEPLYIGRAKYQMSLTPGKIHQSLKACYISFAGTEVAVNMYDVLCRLS